MSSHVTNETDFSVYIDEQSWITISLIVSSNLLKFLFLRQVGGAADESLVDDAVNTDVLSLEQHEGTPVDHQASERRLPVDGRFECVSLRWTSDSHTEKRKRIVGLHFIT